MGISTFQAYFMYQLILCFLWERSGSMVECLTRDREAAGFEPHRRHCIVVFEQDTFYPSLVLVQPRKTRPCLTERLLMGHKESNQNQTKTFVS